MIICVDECFYQCEARDDIVVIFQIYFGVPRCTEKKIVCCDVLCERRGLWKTSVTCTAICSQIDRGIPFSVYPSSAPHHGPLHLVTPICLC